MATNNPIELLIALGVNDSSSRNNIQSYLDKIKKDLKLDIELNTVKGNGDTFDTLRKETESLQKQVSQLNKELSSIGSNKSHSPTLSQGIKQDVVESMKSLDQLKNHIKQQNGEFKIKTIVDAQGLEKIDAVVTRVKTGLNQIQETHLKPILDTNNLVVGLKQVGQTVHDISSKDLKLNLSKGMEELNKFARQGELSKEQYENFKNSISSSINNTELNKVLESMRSINKETAHENKMQNSMANINQQAIELSQKLNQFTKDKNNAFDPIVVDKFIGKLDKLAGINFDSVKGMKSANKDFSSIEKQINTYIKLQEKYKDVTDNLELLQRQGKITSSDLAKFTQDAKIATTVTELNNLNKEINKFGKTTQIDAQISNTFKNIGNEVEQLNNKLKNVTNNFNVPSNNTLFSKIKSDIDSINNMKLNTPEDIKTLNKLISDTSKNIRQLGQDSNSLKQFETKTREINNLLQQMKESGLLTNKEIHKFTDSLSRIETGNLAHVNNLLTQMSGKFDKLKSSEKNLDTFEKQQNSLSRLNSELTRTEKLFPRTMDASKAEKLRKEIESLSKLNIINPTSLKNNQKEIDVLKEKVKQFHAESTQASKGSVGVMEAFKIAMERFPVWMAASTAFYGAIRTAKEFGTILIDIDSKLVSIQKVVDNGTDMGAIFDRATQSAEKFGQSISQALDAYIEFARQGYKGAELGTLADAGLVASNVGEITAQQASEYMTASLVQWKKDASEAMGIIDSWNNISNNFATTTEKLAKGQARAGATANAMGLEYDQLNAIIGTVTASTKQSGDEVGNFVKNVLPRLVSAPAQDALNMVNVSLTDKQGNMRDIIQVYTEVANKVKELNDTERISVMEGLAGKYHISRMQALLDDLGSAKSMYREMYETSKDSAGSALRENEIYMKSLEARIALTKVEFEKLAVSIGDAFLTDGMVAFLQVASGGLGVITKLVDGIGLLPVVLGTVGMSTFALSTRFRTLSTSVGSATVTLLGFNGAQKSTDLWNKMLTASTRTLGVAWKGFLASLGVGIPLILVGVALEKLMGKMGDARQKAEELESQTKQTMDSYKSNKDSINELANEYSKLEKAMSDGDKSDSTLQKHAEVADELGKIMPSLVQGEDTYGRKVVGSSDAVKIRVEMLQKQLEIQEKIAQAEAREKRDDNIDTYKDSIKDSQGAIDSYLDVLKSSSKMSEDISATINDIPEEKRFKFIDDNGKPVYQTFKDVENGIVKVEKALKEANASGDEKAIEYYTEALNGLNETYQEISPYANDIIKNTESLRLVYSDSINDIINSNSELDESVKESAKNITLQLLNAVNKSDLDNVKSALENLFSGVQFSDVSNDLIKVFADLEGASEESFGKMEKNAEKFLSTLPDILKSSGMKAEDVSAVMEVLKKKLSDTSTEHKKLAKEAKESGVSLEQAKANAVEFGEGAEQASESVSELASKMKDYKDATEAMAGVSQSGVEALNDLIFQYDMLTNQLAGYTQQQLEDIYIKENLSAEELSVKKVLDDRVAIMKELSGLYPDLLGKDGKAIALSEEKRKAIEQENKANEVLLKGYKLARDGKLSAEEQATLASATATRARIENIKKEIQALSILQKKLQEAYNDATKSMEDEDPNSYTYGMKAYRAGTLLGQAQSGISNYTSELEGLQSQLNTNIDTIDGFNTAIENSSKSTSGNTKAQKENNAEKEKSIWITDEYKQKLEELTLAIEKQQKIQARFPEHSKEYKKSLEAQIKLEKEKLALQEKQVKAIQSQIASGKIQQTGNVTVKSINGYSGKITSGYGERSDNHRGVDIAMPTGTRVDAPVSGKVIKAGSATSDTNGKKMDWTYGNLVVIEDKDGIRHLLAHLDSTLVKVGDQVEAGTQIGKSGNSGYTTGAHLHYEQNNSKGQTINPTATLNSIRAGSSPTSSTSSQQAIVWNYFKSKGLNDKAIAGLLGNIQQESSFNSSLVNKSTGASGIFQWLGGRKTGLQDYAKSVGKSWTDLQVQLDYAWKELNGSEKKALASLQRSDLSSSQHASEFERLFERSGGSQVGKRQDYANQYYNQFAGTNGSSGVGIDTTQQAIDQAKSDYLGLQKDVLNSKETIENLNDMLVKANIAYYDDLINSVDLSIKKSNILSEQQSEHSKAYRDELKKESKHLEYKQSLLHKEANFIRTQLKRTDISPALKDELANQLSELSLSWWDVAESIKNVEEKIQNSKVESYIAKYEELRQIQDKTINYEKAKLEELDTSSARYVKTLMNINNAMREKQNSNRYELTQLTALINRNELTGEALKSARQRIDELTLGIKELQITIQNGDYDILINIKTQSDEKVGIMESAINQAEAIRKMFDEGSVDYVKYTKIILAEYEKIAQQHLSTRDALVEELKQRDITAERIKEVKKLMADEHIAYLNATLSIKDYTKQVEKANESQLSNVADKVINAYKEYVQERRDEHIKMLDDEIKRENEKHEQIIKQLNDEMDLFRKNVEDKIRLIDRQESQRSYDMEISDLEKERNNVQSEFDSLALDNSHEAKAKRKKLQEQLDEIDKNIAEKRHDREVELRKESLNDALEAKEEETNEKIELQDKEHENEINKINRKKEYWEKHYKDLLNDEREFAKIREAILSGHFEKVNADFMKYIGEMEATLPELADTLDDTMDAVGMSIRNNVIDNLKEALNLINEFNNSQKGSDNGSFNFDPNDGNGSQSSNGNLSEADLQVLLGKFLYDNVAPNTSGKDKDKIRQLAEQLAEQGRKNGSTQFTKDDVNFNDSIQGLTQAEMDSLYEYFDGNKGMLGGKYDSFIEQFISSISGNKHESTNDGSLSKADMQVMLGKFIYEKLVPDPSLSTNTKTALKAKADGVASQGRRNGSPISENVTFDAVKSTYTSAQVNQMKSFFDSNLGMVDNATTRELMQRKIASLDTGGLTNWSGLGVDGKGGKYAIMHPHERILTKDENARFFDSINVMDKIMSNLSPFLSKFTPPQKNSPVVSGDTYGDIKIDFHIDKMNGDRNDLDRLSKMIDNNLLRKKGMRK